MLLLGSADFWVTDAAGKLRCHGTAACRENAAVLCLQAPLNCNHMAGITA